MKFMSWSYGASNDFRQNMNISYFIQKMIYGFQIYSKYETAYKEKWAPFLVFILAVSFKYNFGNPKIIF